MMSKILDFVAAHWLAIYIVVALTISFLGGYVDPDEPKDYKGRTTIRADVVFVAGFWPVFAFIGTLASPIWVPLAFAELGAFWAKRQEQKETVEKALEYAKLTKKEPEK